MEVTEQQQHTRAPTPAREGAVRGREETTFYVVSYDIPHDRRRARIHKVLSGFGEWQQFSLFECFLTTAQHMRLQDQLRQIVDPAEDQVRIYRLCQGCVRHVQAIGRAGPQERTTYIV